MNATNSKTATMSIDEVKLTTKNMNDYPVLYMVFANLSGLHDKVYKMRLNEKIQSWWDSSGTFDIKVGEHIGSNSIRENIVKYITTDKEDAEKVFNFSKMLMTHLKNRI